MQVKKQQLEPDQEQQTGSKLGKEYVMAVYCHHVYLTYMQSTLSEMLDWMNHKLESRLPGEISITSDMQMTPPLWEESEEELKSLLMKVKEVSEKASLKLNIQKTKIMASSPITSWQIDGQTMEIVTGFIFLGSKITVDGDCKQEIKRLLAPWKKSYDQPRQNIKKQRHYFANKGPSRQSYGFPSSHIWMWELDHKEGCVPKILSCGIGEDS